MRGDVRSEPVRGRRRPLWLVAALAMLSLGMYIPIWFGLTWYELRAETSDARKQPLGHALSILVPGWNAWQTWRHFGEIDRVLTRLTVRPAIDATSAAIGLVIWWLTFTHYSSEPLFLALDAIELLAGTAVLVYGQRALNAYWAWSGAEERLFETDLIALGLAATFALLTLLGIFFAPS